MEERLSSGRNGLMIFFFEVNSESSAVIYTQVRRNHMREMEEDTGYTMLRPIQAGSVALWHGNGEYPHRLSLTGQFRLIDSFLI